jgi:hypothetical protein
MSFALNPRRVGGQGMARHISDLLEADSMSFLKGELVVEQSNALDACVEDAVIILGIAQKNATNVSSGNIIIPVEELDPNALYLMRCWDKSDAAGITCDNLTRHNNYGLVVISNVWYVDNDETSADAVNIVKYHKDANGDYDEWVYVRFLRSVCQGYTGA